MSLVLEFLSRKNQITWYIGKITQLTYSSIEEAKNKLLVGGQLSLMGLMGAAYLSIWLKYITVLGCLKLPRYCLMAFYDLKRL